jgi:hypothetical protein
MRSNAAMTALPIARVPMLFSPGNAMSPVRCPCCRTRRTACSIRHATAASANV